MNPVAFIAALWAALGIGAGLQGDLSAGGAAPVIPVIVLAYVCLHIPAGMVGIVGILVGLLLDLMTQVPFQSESGVVVGPHALGCFFAAQLVLAMRGLMFSRGVFSIVILATVAALLAELGAAFVIAIRSIYDPMLQGQVSGTGLLLSALGSAAYTGIAAVLVGPVLIITKPWFGFRGDRNAGFTMK